MSRRRSEGTDGNHKEAKFTGFSVGGKRGLGRRYDWYVSLVNQQSSGGRQDVEEVKGIRMKSKVPGVMITQFMEELPEGMTTPDFTRKPIALTIQEGKFAVFKAIVVGTPTPAVTWSRANGEITFHPDMCQQKYDEVSHEHTLEFPKVAPEDADTYKCFATNEYGRAVCPVVLNVISDATDFRKGLKKRKPDGTREEKQMEPEDKVWEILLSADKKDYEQICRDYGVTDFRGMLKKLSEMKREREEEIAEFVSHISTLKHIEVSDDDCATIELDMDLKDPSSKIFLYKDGAMVPFSIEESESSKHSLKKVGKKYIFTIKKLGSEDAGLYSVDVGGVNVFSTDFKDPGVHFHAGLSDCKAIIGEAAELECKVSSEECQGIWSKDGEELQRKDSGEVKIKLKNEFGTVEAFSQLLVMDKPTPPMGPLEIVEASSHTIEFKWRPPKDSGGCKIGNYILERQQVGRNTWKKVGPIGPEAIYKDSDVDHGRRYCYRIRVETEIGTSELMETEDIQAGTKAYPAPPSAPKVVSAFKKCITLSWSPPSDTGGTNILGYNVEKRKKGSNLWGQVNPPEMMIRAKEFAVKDVVEGMEYEFRVSAINDSGAGEFSSPSEFVFARDPKKPPGKVIDFKVSDSSYTTLSLSWTKPKDIEGVEDEAKGYFVELRPAENTEWDRCNSNAITLNFYTVRGMKSMAMYWVRIIATNDGGEGQPQELANYILAMPPPVRPRFTDSKIKSFMVVRAGNSARFTTNFEASPWPEVTWVKDGVPVSKKVTISNAEGTSQLLIPSAERSDSGIYTILVKNIVGQETFSVEIRVTDEPKPPGPVELDENVPGTVTISWTASPDEKRDDRLHYMVTKRDSVKTAWHTVADHIFNNKFTACNIMPGREYQFRVYAKNDMGSSKPSESAKWLISAKKVRIKKKSRVPGVMITQYVEEVPEGMTTPDFTRKPIALTIQEGKLAIFRAVVIGKPTPTVTWVRNEGEMDERYKTVFDSSGEHQLQLPDVSVDQADTYKCFAVNEYGKAIVTATLNVIEDKKDYENICAQYGITDFRWMLKKLNEMKTEKEQEQGRVVERLCNLKPIELNSSGGAEFEFEDPTTKIFLYKDGIMIPFDADAEIKHGLKQVGKKFVFNGFNPEDAGLYQVEVDGIKIFTSDFKLPPIEFLVKIQDVKAEEREDAVFECLISQPLKKITWKGKNTPLEQGDKYDILVSEDMLIHTLVVKDCMTLDKGIYAAEAGLVSCSAWLVVEDVAAIIGTDAELVCRLSSEECDGVWYKDGKEITATDDICIVKDRTSRKLIIKNCKEDDAGKYRCEADGRKTEAVLHVEDPPRINPDDLAVFIKPVIIKAGKEAAFKVSFVGREPMKIQWYNEGEEMLEDSQIKIEKSSSHSRLLLTKCQRKITGEIKIKIKNECGTTEAITQFVVLDKPTTPLGPVDIIESSSTCIDFKWRPPKDNGGSPITDYILERQQIGRNSWKKLGKIGPEPKYRDTDVDHGRKYCYHIRAETDQDISEMMETDDIQAGTKAYPGPPSTPKIVSAFKDCINLAWSAPTNTGGTNLLGYNVEKRKNGSNLWGLVNHPDEPIREKKYAVKDVVEGIEYEFRVSAINISGAGEPSSPSEFVFARDPKKPPSKVIDLKVTDSTYTTLSLCWTKPTEEEGVQDEAKGYFVELRPAENPEWGSCNSSPIIMTSYTIMGLKSMAMYWASPIPTIKWLKDGLPVAKHVTVSNSDTSSQLIIPSSERQDTGIYTIIVKNLVGQETSSVEIRITDDPKPPGPVELDENVSGTVTVSWTPSPDEKKDDRLHYVITKRDSTKRTWQTVADHLFNNKFTAINIIPGRQYQFRVYAKNDMGISKPTESATWEVKRTKGRFTNSGLK
ncbi:hypothetical protein F2P81_012378 [Scophthalmus maximus]|uniref:Immunoglobulin-like and fibronectin type III domain-containing protein 1 n=1 Tax=Scophthalmus maximus TaxID=52904 RepID=A0A6A4SRY5_SCOMX|nr:hypothetical protein F2P81_012378 [Scophthalmus maximus]